MFRQGGCDISVKEGPDIIRHRSDGAYMIVSVEDGWTGGGVGGKGVKGGRGGPRGDILFLPAANTSWSCGNMDQILEQIGFTIQIINYSLLSLEKKILGIITNSHHRCSCRILFDSNNNRTSTRSLGYIILFINLFHAIHHFHKMYSK